VRSTSSRSKSLQRKAGGALQFGEIGLRSVSSYFWRAAAPLESWAAPLPPTRVVQALRATVPGWLSAFTNVQSVAVEERRAAARAAVLGLPRCKPITPPENRTASLSQLLRLGAARAKLRQGRATRLWFGPGPARAARPNQSFKRTVTGMPALAFISFWAKAVLPAPAA
jgi:hypothetical protein